MRLFVSVVLLTLALGIFAKDDKNGMLLGADDVDKKHAEMAEADDSKSPPEVHSVKEAKKLVKEDKKELHELQERARALKERLQDSKQLSKDEKKALKKDFRAAKKTAKAKRKELTTHITQLKTMKSEKQTPTLSPVSSAGKRGGRQKNKGGRKNKKGLELIGAEESKLNNPESFGLQSELAVDEPIKSKKDMKKLKKKSRKAERKQNRKKNRKGSMSEEKPRLRMGTGLSDEPNEPTVHSGKSHRGRKGNRGRRVSCTTDADCLNGAVCFTNRKGHKFCKGNGMDKTAGKKCHRSEQCARGLMCFVKGTANTATGKHRKPKGICADPNTADMTKGYFMPFLKTHQ